MLELGMDMEADLGIDSIKRVEILGSVQEEITDLPELNPEDLAELRTLGEIVDYMKSKAQAVAPSKASSNLHLVETTINSTASSIDLEHIQSVMMDVVAEKTGYPSEMLELGMDMEADLGIDSIKRVEILGSVQEIIADLPELNPEDLAELRTLGEIVTYMQSKVTVENIVEGNSASPTLTSSAAPAIDLDHIQSVMMDVVAEKTGYPSEMLELGMDMEADLGIDSIKRVEILGSVQEIIEDLPELNPEDLAELRTLGEIVSYMQSKVQSKVAVETVVSNTVDNKIASTVAQTPAAPAIDLDHIQSVMMNVVAEKTGYPSEMLELGMDMEADLGIDSIKRVEILGAVQEIIEDLPELNPEDLAELRTLGEIVTYMQSKVQPAAVVEGKVATAALAMTEATSTVSIDLDHIQSVMMSVVADKTGYPSDMLELGMDMEADLGIDSIKRVEILGAVQEIIEDLPELNPEDLAELRTLGEIVSYMQSKVAVETVVINTVESTIAQTSAAPAIDLDHIQSVMMTVVAEKTGYPSEMLELGMDMEADLGIDSIKRVEILGAVQEIIEDLPELNPEDLAELRTLGEIVSYMQSRVSPTEPEPTDPAPTSSSSSLTPSNNSSGSDTTTASSSLIDHAPSATVAVQTLSSVTKIVQSSKGANALVVDDGSGAAIALSAKLVKEGFHVTALKPSWVKSTVKKTFAKAVNVVELAASALDSAVHNDEIDEASVKQAIENIEAEQGSLDAVFYLHQASKIDQIEYPQAAKQGLMLAFVLAKLCNVKAAKTARASFVVVTRQGGTLGFSNEQVKANAQTDLVQAGLCGLVKTLSHEWPSVFCRTVDLSTSLAAQKAADFIYDEFLDVDTSLIEVAYDSDSLVNESSSLSQATNHVRRLTLIGEVTDSYNLVAGNTIDKSSVFLVSGGAKGVTAHCAIELAKQYQASFILLGRSTFDSAEPTWAQDINDEVALKKAAMQALIASGDKPTPVKVTQFIRPVLANREIAQTLAAITAAGGKAHYVAADVTNAVNVATAVKPVVEKLGQVSGIIHGAGVLADKFIEQKTLSEFNAVYSTKIDGLLSLLACVDQSKLKHLVLFSSAAGFYGNPGQSDYSIANEILNKTAYRFKALHPSSQVLSFNWGPWDGGMVTPELKRMFNDRGVYIIPLDAGAQLLASELAANSNRCPQILVGNDLSKDTAKDTANEKGDSVKKPQVSRLSNRVVKTLLATNNKFLADHTIGNDQVLPTVCALAWMSDACQASYAGYSYQGFSEYKLFKGVIFDEVTLAKNEPVNFFIEMKAQVVGTRNSADDIISDGIVADDLLVETKISSEVIGDNGEIKTVHHYGAQLHLATKRKVLTHAVIDNEQRLLIKQFSSSNTNTVSEQAKALYQNGTLFHGESLQGITEVLQCDEQHLLLACQVPNIASEKQSDFPISSQKNSLTHNIFANDLVYQAMLVWVKEQLGLGSLPSSTKAWTVYRQVAVNELFYLKLNVVKATGLKVEGKPASKRGSLEADIQLISTDNQLLAEIKSAKVTASASLNNLFLPENTLSKITQADTTNSVKPNEKDVKGATEEAALI
jgi:polyketide-type polyunsaturated fatty acid synthase PfaA